MRRNLKYSGDPPILPTLLMADLEVQFFTFKWEADWLTATTSATSVPLYVVHLTSTANSSRGGASYYVLLQGLCQSQGMTEDPKNLLRAATARDYAKVYILLL